MIKHFTNSEIELISSYDEMSSRFAKFGNLTEEEFDSSRSLFERSSLEERIPSPKCLEVVAVVAGLPFTQCLQNKLILIQQAIQNILGDTLTYWVKPENLALEFFVIKWPDQDMAPQTFDTGKDFLSAFDRHAFQVHFNGFQIHRDGCVVARGIDTSGIIRTSRSVLQEKELIPQRQSSWAHVPLGRILEPFSNQSYSKLIEITGASQQEVFHSETIDNIKLIHELQWYMENKTTVSSTDLPRKDVDGGDT